MQRGLKVYKEVCAACHALSYIAFRNLADPGGPGYSAAQAAAFAAEYKIKDGPNDQGEMFERPGRPADYFPSPFPNEQAARAANGGALPPDLSLITKARSYERGFPKFVFDFFTQFQEQGPNYVDALLQGFEEKPPAGVTLPDGSYYNKYFPGHAIKMPKPLSDGQVTYDDGSPATVAQYAKDVTTFLMWAAEPHMEARKRLGMQVFVFLILLHRPAVLHQEEGLGRRALSLAAMTEFGKAPAGAFLLCSSFRGGRAATEPGISRFRMCMHVELDASHRPGMTVSRLHPAPTADKIAANRPPQKNHRRNPWVPASRSSARTARTPAAISPTPRAATRRAWS